MQNGSFAVEKNKSHVQKTSFAAAGGVICAQILNEALIKYGELKKMYGLLIYKK